MSSKVLRSFEFRDMLRKRAAINGQNALAREIGITNGHLSRIIRGEKMAGPKVCTHFGYHEEVVYRRMPLSMRKGTTP